MVKELPLFLEYLFDEKNANKEKSAEKWKKRGYKFASAKLLSNEIYEKIKKEKPYTVGVYIPTLNSEKTLEITIKSIINQTYPIDKFIIVDGHSNDKTTEIARKYNIKVVYQEGKGLSNARNTALNYLDTDLICGIDADIEISPTYIETMVIQLEKHPEIVGIQGRVIDIPYSPIEEWRYRYMPLHHGLEEKVNPPYLSGSNGVFRRKDIIKIGGWIDRFTAAYEDCAFSQKVYNSRYKLLYYPKEVLYHHKKDDLYSLCKTRWIYAKPHWEEERKKGKINDFMLFPKSLVIISDTLEQIKKLKNEYISGYSYISLLVMITYIIMDMEFYGKEDNMEKDVINNSISSIILLFLMTILKETANRNLYKYLREDIKEYCNRYMEFEFDNNIPITTIKRLENFQSYSHLLNLIISLYSKTPHKILTHLLYLFILIGKETKGISAYLPYLRDVIDYKTMPINDVFILNKENKKKYCFNFPQIPHDINGNSRIISIADVEDVGHLFAYVKLADKIRTNHKTIKELIPKEIEYMEKFPIKNDIKYDIYIETISHPVSEGMLFPAYANSHKEIYNIHPLQSIFLYSPVKDRETYQEIARLPYKVGFITEDKVMENEEIPDNIEGIGIISTDINITKKVVKEIIKKRIHFVIFSDNDETEKKTGITPYPYIKTTNEKRFVKRKTGFNPFILNKMGIPINIQIMTTSSCNGRCIFCPYVESWHHKNAGIMSDETINRMIEELKPLHIGRLCPYFENEPFTDRRILQITEKLINNLKFDVLHFSTNGVFLDENTSIELLKMTKNIPFEMWFSFHGKNKEQVEEIMKIPYDTALENMVRFIKLSEDYPNVIVRIRGSGSSRILKNEKPYFFSKEEYLRMWQEIVRKYGIRKNLDIDSFTYHDRAGSIKRNEFNYNMIARESLENFYCERIDRWIHFLYTGEIVLCCMDYHRETVFGNINEKSLFEIFYSKEYEELKLKSTGFIKSEKYFICKRCFSPGG